MTMNEATFLMNELLVCGGRTGAPELCGCGRGVGGDPAVGETRSAGQSGLRAVDPAAVDGDPPRGGASVVPQRSGVAAPHGKGQLLS